MSTHDIENLLRRAPQPKPPGNLNQKLKAQALSRNNIVAQTIPDSGSWFRRWWPALAPAALSAACAAALTIQQVEIRSARSNVGRPISEAASAASTATFTPGTKVAAPPGSTEEQEELGRLQTLAAKLRSEVSKLEQTKAENDKLRAQLASSSAGVFTSEEIQALESARERVGSIRCVNNLKQLGLAVKVWSLDNHDMTPPNVQCLSNEMSSLSILICPSDSGRQAAKDLASLTPSNCSYEYLCPSAPNNESDRILFRCPIHGHIGLCDGSVQSKIGKEHPDWIVQRDGKFLLRRVEPPSAASSPPTGATNQ
jgi:hypothetical protein